MTSQEQLVSIPLETLNQVYKYLAAKPYVEAAPLVELLLKAKAIPLTPELVKTEEAEGQEGAELSNGSATA